MKLAMISSWHVHARGYAEEFKSNPDCEVVAVWDESKEAGTKWAEELGCPFYEDYEAILKNPEIDAVAITSPTCEHPDLLIRAAEAGKHIFTEKVLAIKAEDAKRICEAIKKNNIKFVISFPYRSRPDFLLAKQMVEEGKLGQITYARMRDAHNGTSAGWLPDTFYEKETCGGGAMMDLGAHPVYLLNWLLGLPKTVRATFTKVFGKPVEDNAVSVFEYENGAIGVAETGFVSGFQLTLEVNGTKGSLRVEDGLAYATEETENKWVKAEAYPEALPKPVDQFVAAVVEGKESGLCVADAVDLSLVMDAAYRSYESGKPAEV